MTKYLYVLSALFLFGLGAYTWKVKNTGLVQASKDMTPGEYEGAVAQSPSTVVVEIAGDKVTEEDIDWEYQLVTEGLHDKDELTPIPDLGARRDKELVTLRKSLIASLIERKLLYKYIQQDKEFSVDDPGRYQQCMAELQESLTFNAELARTRDVKTRLRARLCERSILDQYLKERLFVGLKVSESEIVEYFKNHVGEFKRADRVEIRQVLLADEDAAKRVRATITSSNFAEVASAKSIAPEAVDGGRLGPFSKATLPAIFEVAWHLKPSQISDIIKSPYGYHVIILLAKHSKEELSLDEARPRIASTLLKKKEETEYQALVEKALATITVNTPKPLW